MRATNGAATRQRRNRTLKRAKGFRAFRGTHYRMAKETGLRADAFAYAHRRTKKRDFRRLWITRLNAATRAHGMRYSQFIAGLNKAGISLNRKELSELAIHDEAAFGQIVAQAKNALA